MTLRPPTLARRGMIAAPHPLAAEAGVRMLRAGGHAIDAAIAAGAVLSVVEPSASGLGGDAFFLTWDRSDRAVSAVNGAGAAPAGLRADRFTGPPTSPVQGAASLTVPGCVDAWHEAWYGWGRLSWRELLEPAIALAEGGFAVSCRLARVLRRERATLAADPGLAAMFLRDGSPLGAGAICRPEALGRTLKAIARDGAEALYMGPLADRLGRGVRAAGGVLSSADLAQHESELRGAVEAPVGEFTLCTQPLPSQGLLLPLAWKILERTGAAGGRSEMHRQVEAVRIAFAVRDLFLADPRGLPLPEADLLGALFDERTLGALAALVGKSTRGPRVEEIGATVAGGGAGKVPGDVQGVTPGDIAGEVVAAISSAGPEARAMIEAYGRAGFAPAAAGAGGTDTTYLCVADGDGNVAGLIQSLFHPFGCGVLETGTGIILNDRAAGFSLDPHSPNRLEPGRRPRHTLHSWMLLGSSGPRFAGGTPGAHNQVAVNLQVLRALLAGRPLWSGPPPMRPEKWTEGRLDAAPAIPQDELLAAVLEMPRWDLDPLGRVRVEARAPGECRRLLRRAGHEAVRGGPWDGSGFFQAIQFETDGVLLGATDPRGEGIALGL